MYLENFNVNFGNLQYVPCYVFTLLLCEECDLINGGSYSEEHSCYLRARYLSTRLSRRISTSDLQRNYSMYLRNLSVSFPNMLFMQTICHIMFSKIFLTFSSIARVLYYILYLFPYLRRPILYL